MVLGFGAVFKFYSMNERLDTKTIGIKIWSANPVDWSLVDLSRTIAHLRERHADRLPERIVLKKDYSCCVLKCEKALRVRNPLPWNLTIDNIQLIIEYTKIGARRNKMAFFERIWKEATQSESWTSWSSDAYKTQTFHTKLANMDTETEMVLALQKQYGEKYFDQNIDRKLKNIERLKKANAAEEMEDFEFIWPSHLESLKINNHGLFQWFESECKSTLSRRKCLVLYSKHRAMGKTRFAKMITGDMTGTDQKHYIITRGMSFTKENFTKVAHPKLLIMDDMELKQVKMQEAIFKALVTSEEVNIRDCYINYEFKHGLPTIMTLNSGELWDYLRNSDMFKQECIFVEVNSYIGPPGTNQRNENKIPRSFKLSLNDLQKEDKDVDI